ncbi:MAG: type II secretion system GspH family protein [Fibrobacter sp.]|nr:type II secretion system GspH family protein [Fibrobacter sp.]
MQKKGFTLIELMVTVVIVGILAGIAVPKMFGQTVKAKAAEVTPAAATYITLQKAFVLEHKGIGTWKRIGYEAPGNGETKNFTYGKGDVTASIRQNLFKSTLSSDGTVAWTAENNVGLNACYQGNKWVVAIYPSGNFDVTYKMKLLSSETSSHCAALTGKDWETSDSPSVDEQ